MNGVRARGVDPIELVARLPSLGLADYTGEYSWLTAGRHVMAAHPLAESCALIAERRRKSFKLCAKRIHELGGSLLIDASAAVPPVGARPFPDTPSGVLTELLEGERAALPEWWGLYDLASRGDFRTLEIAQRVLGSKIEHEILLIDGLTVERGR